MPTIVENVHVAFYTKYLQLNVFIVKQYTQGGGINEK